MRKRITGCTTGRAGPLKTVSESWAPLAKNADEVSAREGDVLGLAGNADRFS